MQLIEASFRDSENPYKELVRVLEPFHDRPQGDIGLVVEGTLAAPLIVLQYPGRRVKRRVLKRPRKDSPLWDNLFDFFVVPYVGGVPAGQDFGFRNLLDDFIEFKRKSDGFWSAIVDVYKNNRVSENPPTLGGRMDSKVFLLALKWIWIQEELNYEIEPTHLGATIPYRLEKRGVGKTKFYAGLCLARTGEFTCEQIVKIIF